MPLVPAFRRRKQADLRVRGQKRQFLDKVSYTKKPCFGKKKKRKEKVKQTIPVWFGKLLPGPANSSVPPESLGRKPHQGFRGHGTPAWERRVKPRPAQVGAPLGVRASLSSRGRLQPSAARARTFRPSLSSLGRAAWSARAPVGSRPRASITEL